MAKITELIHAFHTLPQVQSEPVPLDVEAIKAALIKKIEQFGIDGVTVSEVEVDDYGILVTFVDYEDDEMDVYFVHDEGEGSMAIILDDEEDTEYLVVDLDSLAPTLIQHGATQYINMGELSWFNKSALSAILMAGELDTEDGSDNDMEQEDVELDTETDTEYDYGYFHALEAYAVGEEAEIEELFAQVVRGGKRVKLAIVKKVRRKRLSATKRMGIRRAVRKRKQKASRIARKTKRSLKIRKRLGIKKKSLGKFRKIAGTSNRKR